MDPFSNARQDFYPLAEEKFDFDVSLSPASSRGDEEGEDDVFVGPVTDKEKGICTAVEYLAKDSVSSSGPSVGEEQMWSPLTGDNFDRMCSEALQLATQLKDDQPHTGQTDSTVDQPHTGQTDSTVPAERQGNVTDVFVQDTGSKLDMFSKPFNRVLSPIKRETFCVQDSPVKQLPPAIQKRLLKGRSSSIGTGVCVNSTRARLSTSSPASGSNTKTQPPKMALRSKAGMGTVGILPSKLVVPATTSATSLKTANTVAVPAEKPSRMAPPSKAGLRSKAPHLQTRGVVDGRRNTSSSSSSVSSLNSSVSSFNCSMSVSPTGNGNLNTSLNRSKNGSSSRAPTNMSRLANTSAAKTGQTRRSTLTSRAAESKPSATATTTVTGARRSISVQSRKTSETDPTKLARSTPVKRAVPSTPTPFQQSPAKRALVSTSVSSLSQFGPRAKPVALIAPTPTSRLKGPKRSDVVQSPDSVKIMKPKRLMSSGSMDSPTPELFNTPSMSKIRRPSALPTPVNRRISGIPTMTPKSLAGFCRPSPSMCISARRTSNRSPTQVESTVSEVKLVISPKIQPFCLEDADPPVIQLETQNEAPTCVTVQGPEVFEQKVVEHPDEHQEPEAIGNLMKLHSAEEVISEDHRAKAQEGVEMMLVDVPASKPEGSKPEEDKTLIDLFNTPDLIRPLRPVPLKLVGEKELIDLSSPLIKWSPEDQKENAVKEAPLINLSF